MQNYQKQIEGLMGDVLSVVSNKMANFKVLAQIAVDRKLTEHESESMTTQVDLCKALIRERFLKDLVNPDRKTE